MRTMRPAFAALMLAAAASCAPARVQTVEGYAGPTLPRPDRVLVYDFTVAPEQVRLDQGIGPRVARTAAG